MTCGGSAARGPLKLRPPRLLDNTGHLCAETFEDGITLRAFLEEQEDIGGFAVALVIHRRPAMDTVDGLANRGGQLFDLQLGPDLRIRLQPGGVLPTVDRLMKFVSPRYASDTVGQR